MTEPGATRIAPAAVLTPARAARSGAVAGAGAAFVFVVVHHVFISNIWFSLPVLVVAGALCGVCLGWSYALVVDRPTPGSWFAYNAGYVVLLFALGAVSLLAFEPQATIAALVAADEPPGDLIAEALPMIATFTVLGAAVIGAVYARRLREWLAILLTAVVLVALLGLNVSVIGLVDIPTASWYLIAELLGLIVVLAAVFAVVFAALERRRLAG